MLGPHVEHLHPTPAHQASALRTDTDAADPEQPGGPLPRSQATPRRPSARRTRPGGTNLPRLRSDGRGRACLVRHLPARATSRTCQRRGSAPGGLSDWRQHKSQTGCGAPRERAGQDRMGASHRRPSGYRPLPSGNRTRTVRPADPSHHRSDRAIPGLRLTHPTGTRRTARPALGSTRRALARRVDPTTVGHSLGPTTSPEVRDRGRRGWP